MNTLEAYKILALKNDATKEEINKQFRKLAAQSHPDVNKSKGAEEKYKKISEAYEFLKNNDGSPAPFNFARSGHVNNVVVDFINNFTHPHASSFRRVSADDPPVKTNVKISFKESVLGCTQKVNVKRSVPCFDCSGQGHIQTPDQCPACGGTGHMRRNAQSRHASTVIVQFTCRDCEGCGKVREKCTSCNSSGVKTASVEFDVKLPGGIIDDQTIRLPNAGNFIQGSYPYHRFGDAYLAIQVVSQEEMFLSGNNVMSNIEINLLDSLKGIIKKVKTVKGDMTLNIREKTKNKDEIKLSGYGVNGIGDHIFIINVKYPDDVTDLIKTLER